MTAKEDLPAEWQVWVDTGGTFTDCIAMDPARALHRAKVLSSSTLRGRVSRPLEESRFEIVHDWWPAGSGAGEALIGMRVRVLGKAPGAADDAEVVAVSHAQGTVLEVRGRPLAATAGDVIELSADEEAPVLAARLLTGTPVGTPLPAMTMRLGTTRGTNALLERGSEGGERGGGRRVSGEVALFITEGFADLLEIGTQQRPDLFALEICKPAPLHARTVEVAERLSSEGAVLQGLDLAAVARRARDVLDEGVRSAAVALLHSWLNPVHERQLGLFLREMGFDHVSLSSDLAPLIKILPRAQTTVVNAYLAEVMERYLTRVSCSLDLGARGGRPQLLVMTSSGGLVSAGEFQPKDSLLSGPAGGVVGAAAAGRAAGCSQTIAFDMGGTSTDVSRFDGDYQYVFEHVVGAARIVAPALAIETVAAGGGSICRVEHGVMRVGPQSAGANPGPACYGAGGPFTITDCNLLLGRLDPGRFGIPVDQGPARARLEALAEEVSAARGGGEIDLDDLLEGFLEIACERMAEAIARISVRQGYDASGYALVAFGGAGGQHACAVAARLGMRTIVLPRDAGLLSAAGLGQAVIERFAERQVLAPLDDVDLAALTSDLAAEAVAKVRAEGARTVVIRRRLVQMRLAGQESTITVEHEEDSGREVLRNPFLERYQQLYGHEPPDRELEIESARIVASSVEVSPLRMDAGAVDRPHEREPRRRRVRLGGRWTDVPVHERAALAPGRRITGPALVVEAHSTSVIEPGWELRVHESGALVVERVHESVTSAGVRGVAGRAVRDEVSTGRLAAIARDMGEMLKRTALSTNVKERLDFSCAILDAKGQLIVNAPHVPVHLGALGVCVRRIREAIPMGPGDAVVTNHPAFGGSHLPDITVITPVHDADGALLAHVACRAHHAEIGGIAPGSMPMGAASLAEEGAVIPPMYLIRAGRADWATLERLLTSGPWPSRAVAENLADLRAQVAANRYGADQLLAFARSEGADELRHAMEVLTRRAAAGADRALAQLAALADCFEAIESLDDGALLRVRIEPGRRGGPARIDFTGSAPVHAGNLNATPAIVRSAVMYVLRLLVSEPLPLNEGLLANVELVIPEGILSPPFVDDAAHCPPVAGGNVETSQRLVDVLLKAIHLCACSQGTMNNTVFGTKRFGYYETVCGGAGAGPGFAGASAVHTHMTNTRITDPEILEHRYPVRLWRFAVRRGSGGAGAFRGGDGVIREIEFLEPCELSIITQHRTSGPYGVDGGADGAPGRQWIAGPGGTRMLAGIDAAQIAAGDRLILETPGGGGWGR